MKDEIWEEDLKYINPYEFKYYIFGLLTYKHISERIESHLNNELKNDEMTFEEAYTIDEYKDSLRAESIENIGFFLEPQYLFKNILKESNSEDMYDDLWFALFTQFPIYDENLDLKLNLFEDMKRIYKNQKINYYEKPYKTIYYLLFNIRDWTKGLSIKELFDDFLDFYSEWGKISEIKENIQDCSEFIGLSYKISEIINNECKNFNDLKEHLFPNEILGEIYRDMGKHENCKEFTPLVQRIILMYLIINFI